MRQLSIALILVLALGAVFTFGLGEGKTVEGTLMDAACAGRAAADAEKVKNHTKSCALMPPCKESGYGVIVNGVFHKFDDAGNEHALAYLEATEKEKDLRIKVTGHAQEDGSVQVHKIEDGGN